MRISSLIAGFACFFLVTLVAHAVDQSAGGTSLEARRAELKRLLNDEWEYTLRNAPELATHIGDNRYNDRLSDFSDKAIADDLEHSRQGLARFEAVDVTGFPEQERLNQALMVRSLLEGLESAKFKDWEMPATQFGGVHLWYPSLPFDSPFRNVKDYDDYHFTSASDSASDGSGDRTHARRVTRSPDAAEISARKSRRPGTGESPTDSLGKSPFCEPLKKFPDSIGGADRTRLRAAMEAAVKNEVAPAYAKFAKFVREDYAPYGRIDPGEWALPDGDTRYRLAVKQQTTTDMTPAEIHELGAKSVAEIETQMLLIAKAQGFSDLKSFNAHIRQDPALHAKSGQQIFDLYAHYRDQMYLKLPQLFGRLPKNKLDVVPMESFRSASRAAGGLLEWRRRWIAAGAHQCQRIRSGEAAAAERGGDRVPRGRARASSAIFDCAGVDRLAAVS